VELKIPDGLLTGKKNFVFVGEAGCGKSELSLNFARRLAAVADKPVHFFDLDMLEIGHMYWNKGNRGLTEDEYLFCYSLRAFFASPIQLSCRLEALTGFERDMIMNEEIIAINQDALADFPDEIRKDESVRIYKRTLENGDIAYALFNMKEEARVEAIDLPENTAVRDVWMKENIPAASNLACKLPPHGVRIFRVTPAN